MNKNLLIVGAVVYGVVAKEIAEGMNCFHEIALVDDEKEATPVGVSVIGKTDDLPELNCHYSNIIIAIGSSNIRLSLLKKLRKK